MERLKHLQFSLQLKFAARRLLRALESGCLDESLNNREQWRLLLRCDFQQRIASGMSVFLTSASAIATVLWISIILNNQVIAQTPDGAAVETVKSDAISLQAFESRDTDGDGQLTKEEFIAGGGPEKPEIMRRDFEMFDWNGDGFLDYDEFRFVWYLVPAAERRILPDAVIEIMESHIAEIGQRWTERDTNGDGNLQEAEFTAANLTRVVPGLEMTRWSDWDRDGDGQVNQAEVRALLELAFGIRREIGEVIRMEGKLANLAYFRDLDSDKNDLLSRDEYVKKTGNNEEAEIRFKQFDVNGDGNISFIEWRDGPGGSLNDLNLIQEFRHLDVDASGKLSHEELNTSRDWRLPLTKYAIPAFDTDGDGEISLREFRLLPQYNQVVAWQHIRNDVDGDEKLSFSEFKWNDGLAFIALRREYFDRLDLNGDNYLDWDEWDSALNFARASAHLIFQKLDKDKNGLLSMDEVLGENAVTQPGEPFDLAKETSLVRREEAFRRADIDSDGVLSLEELSSDDAREAISPGSTSVANKINYSLGIDGSADNTEIRNYFIFGLNLLLIAAVAAYALKGNRKRT